MSSMDIKAFIDSIEPEFEGVEASTLKGDTEFRKLEDWSSMIALMLIARIEEEYGVAVSAEELAEVKTISDLHQLVNGKL